MQKLIFGGPMLPAGRRTWYEKRNGAIIHVKPGDEVDPVEVKRGAAYYVEAGYASLVDDEDEKPEPRMSKRRRGKKESTEE